MSSTSRPDGASIRRCRPVAFAVVVLALGTFGLSGCGVVTAVTKVVHAVRSNKDTIDAFTQKIKGSEATTFEVTYVTTGSSPTTVVYAVQPPKGLAFTNTPTATGAETTATNLDLVVNSTGEYSCFPSASGSGGAGKTCEKLQAASAATQNKIFSFYTPAYWVTFLRDFSLAAGFAGDKVTTSKLTVNGFPMSCVDFNAAGVPGTSTVCTTAAGILGYVKVAANSTAFEIKSYSTSPPASLFELPPGAKVTTVQTPTT
jgi:hypothetical protein